MKQEEFDLIVVGGSPDGLAASALLANQGKRVLLLEPTTKVGSLLETESFVTPFSFNLHSEYLLLDVDSEPLSALQLSKNYGVESAPSRMAFVFQDGLKLFFGRRLKDTLEEVGSKISEKESSKLERMCRDSREFNARSLLYNGSRRKATIPETHRRETVRELLDRYDFSDESLRTILSYLPLIFQMDSRSEGTGLFLFAFIEDLLSPKFVRGGSARLALALSDDCSRNKVTILESQEIERMLLSDGLVKTVRLSNGIEFYSENVMICDTHGVIKKANRRLEIGFNQVFLGLKSSNQTHDIFLKTGTSDQIHSHESPNNFDIVVVGLSTEDFVTRADSSTGHFTFFPSYDFSKNVLDERLTSLTWRSLKTVESREERNEQYNESIQALANNFSNFEESRVIFSLAWLASETGLALSDASRFYEFLCETAGVSNNISGLYAPSEYEHLGTLAGGYNVSKEILACAKKINCVDHFKEG